MIEKIVYDYLSETLSVPVYLEMPEKAPSELVIIEKTGSSRDNFIDYATIVIQSYSDTLFNTATLNETVKSKMFDIIELASISRCDLNADYNFTDDELKRYRYQAVFDLTYYNN